MSTRIQTLKANVQAAARTSGLSKRALAAKAGLHLNTLRSLYAPTWSPTLATLDRLERVLLPQDDPP